MRLNFRSFGVAQALAVGLCTGLLLSSFSCGGTHPTPSRCNKDTCPNGCCEGNTCYGTKDGGIDGVQANEACGLGGMTCQDCTLGTANVCVAGQCRIAMGTGGGSGGGSGGATGGGSGGATGGGSGGSGGSGGAGACNPTSCPTGCCSGSSCYAPAMQNFTRCGGGGAACTSCGMGAGCFPVDGGVGNSCQLPSCTACFDTTGQCRSDKMTMTDPNFCGQSGGVCARCDTANGQVCMGGHCTNPMSGCNAQNCTGCCSGNTCIAANMLTDAQCGINAASCVTCSGGATCNTTTGNCMGGAGGAGGGGGLPGLDGGLFGNCDSVSCPSGCCDPLGMCNPDNSSFGLGVYCGTGGSMCKICLFAPDCATGMAIPGLCQ